mmetsp:Transcript_31009/g.50165  ORF Transcript_31009/g.50165 Transcript_31009/m.50165 type:complete len:309 (-) Transcript_31009:322-1248(-)|eukprot:CAMPEP_0184662470 /NCGR_PEP_ID=MMETSP0308-20130426/43476_1 /TAXON_ID=38269 /ORGANISM="Gloeochaete witrockiana, Strain SAG 46.84" /LENGTH=308 /DNA_ID=CAMNT_0027104523 /DNA_START=76 /DNA_END=1002 /DNA_ORIENTATION=-
MAEGLTTTFSPKILIFIFAAFIFGLLSSSMLQEVSKLDAVHVPHNDKPVWPKGAMVRAHLSTIDPDFFALTRNGKLDYSDEHARRVTIVRRSTMVSLPRQHITRFLLESVIARNVSGDVVETGVAAGGMAILMQSILHERHQTNRKLWLADSWEGLPEPDNEADAKVFKKGAYLRPYGHFEKNMKDSNSFDEGNIQIVRGLFKDTLPRAPIEKIAFLRLDGDMYASTVVALRALYDKVVPGGYIYVDDHYEFLDACGRAVTEYWKEKEIDETLYGVHEQDYEWPWVNSEVQLDKKYGKMEASFWQKSK